MVGEQTGRVFDPNCLTIVWARRFAAYKRPDLVTGNPTMFERMLQRTNYPVQFIWAGKPYPMDHGAIEIFNRLNDLTAKYPRSAVLTGYEPVSYTHLEQASGRHGTCLKQLQWKACRKRKPVRRERCPTVPDGMTTPHLRGTPSYGTCRRQ